MGFSGWWLGGVTEDKREKWLGAEMSIYLRVGRLLVLLSLSSLKLRCIDLTSPAREKPALRLSGTGKPTPQ
jgi:hypothetical protein